MKIVVTAFGLLLQTTTAWAQNTAQHTPHPHSSTSSARADKASPAPEAGMQMGMMKHCKMTGKESSEVSPTDKRASKEMDCAGMHKNMRGSDGASPRH